ncbi:hypothetical protein [Paraburkholderia sp. BCC1884]|uniref:hypothetical protein n=1 Tax=Paraburkholderia sp. BCC1884 TaxID=2562668 RepID=UPI0011829367|nr:hypothetical protein [Paraburkholderia sp. BCC1884]
MITFIFVVAAAAFVPYVATPGIVNGVKALAPKPSAMQYESTPAPASRASDAANRLVSGQPVSDASV